MEVINKTGFLVLKPIVGSWGRGEFFPLRDEEVAIVEMREENDSPLNVYIMSRKGLNGCHGTLDIVIGERL